MQAPSSEARIAARKIAEQLGEKWNKHMEAVYTNPIWDEEGEHNDAHMVEWIKSELGLDKPVETVWVLKKIFSIANIDHSGTIGTRQFGNILKMLQLEHTEAEKVEMMQAMDDDNSGTIEFKEFVQGMLLKFDDESLSDGSKTKLGSMGTRAWSQGQIVWAGNNCLIIIFACIVIQACMEFEFIMVPLVLAYFLTFLLGPVMGIFEKRPMNCNCKCCNCSSCNKENIVLEEEGCWYNAEGEEGDQIKYKAIWECVRLAKVPHALTVLITLALIFSMLGLIVSTLVSSLGEFLDDPVIKDEIAAKEKAFNQALIDAAVIFVPEDDFVEGYSAEDVSELVTMVMAYFEFAFMVFLFLIYIIFEKDPDDAMFKGDNEVAAEIEEMIEYYIVLKTLISMVTGALVAIILTILSIQLGFLFGLLSFVLNYIPNVGSMLAMLLPLPVVLLDTSLESWQQIGAFVGPGIVQGYVGNVLEPTIFGKSLNMTALSILSALVIWSSIWGISGAILSVPLLGIMKILMVHTNHPMAKYCLLLVREDPTLDEAKERKAAGLGVAEPEMGPGQGKSDDAQE